MLPNAIAFDTITFVCKNQKIVHRSVSLRATTYRCGGKGKEEGEMGKEEGEGKGERRKGGRGREILTLGLTLDRIFANKCRLN